MGLSLLLGGCSSDDSSGGGSGGAGGAGGENAGGAGGAGDVKRVEIYSWWISPGEAEALQALVELHQDKHPEDRIFNAAKDSGATTRAELASKIDAGDPPDLFQGNAADLSAFLTAHPDTLEPLDDLLVRDGLDKAIIPDVIDDVTIDGNVYGMPVNIHRENTLLYNKQIFDDNGLEPPTTVQEFLDVCDKLKAAGVTPVATAYQGWILRIMFNSLAMGSMGAKAFHDYMSGGPRDDNAFGAAVDLLDHVLAEYVNDDASSDGFGWTQAADAVFEGKAAMFLHGDWAKGYFVQLGWQPGVDFGVVAAPGAVDMFWYGVDTFSLPKGGPNPDGAWRFLSTVGSTDGQVAFNKLKGSTPVRLDVPKSALDAEGQATLEELGNATYRMRVVSKDAWDTALLDYANNNDKDALLKVYSDNPPTK
jgi:glucose/mannose transport system substrate-binding protein